LHTSHTFGGNRRQGVLGLIQKLEFTPAGFLPFHWSKERYRDVSGEGFREKSKSDRALRQHVGRPIVGKGRNCGERGGK